MVDQSNYKEGDPGHTAYAYDGAGRLIEAKNAHSLIQLQRDDLGRVTQETHNGATAPNNTYNASPSTTTAPYTSNTPTGAKKNTATATKALACCNNTTLKGLPATWIMDKWVKSVFWCEYPI